MIKEIDTAVGYRFETRSACPACASSAVRTRYRSRFDAPPLAQLIRDHYSIDPGILSAGEYRLDQCRDCGTFFQVDVGDSALLSILYSRWVPDQEEPEKRYPGYVQDVQRPLLSRDGHELMAASSWLGVPLRELVTLDYGMGWGLWARIAARLGCRSHGTDLAEARMDFARRHGVVALTDEEIERERFHFINTDQLLEHVPDPRELVARLAAALRPGGILKVSVPSQLGVEQLIGRLAEGQDRVSHAEIMPVMPLEHLNCFTPQGLLALGSAAGLECVKPGPFHLYAFLRHRGTLDPSRPVQAARELIRPWYQYWNPANLYIWLRKPSR